MRSKKQTPKQIARRLDTLGSHVPKNKREGLARTVADRIARHKRALPRYKFPSYMIMQYDRVYQKELTALKRTIRQLQRENARLHGIIATLRKGARQRIARTLRRLKRLKGAA